ncbi:cytochrome P450 [Syncephalis plumigaleata]|nr:cytochrome P450 [Syncephalis plumigaleata]
MYRYYVGQVLGSPAVLVALAFAAGVYHYTSRQLFHPFVGHGFEFVKGPSKFFKKCHEKYGETFSMYMFGRYITIVGRSEIRSVMRAPDDQFSFSDAVMDLMDTVYMFGDTQPNNRFHVPILRRNLAKQLDQFSSRMAEKVALAYKTSVGDANKPCQIDDVSLFIDDMVARAMATCIAQDEKIQNDDEVLRMMRTISRDVARTTLLKRVFPASISRLLTRHVTAMDKNIKVSDGIIQDEVIKRRQLIKELGDDYVPPHDMLSWIADVKDDNGELYDTVIVARRTMQIAFASVTTTSTFALHFIFDVAGYPEYRKKLQEEQDELVRLYGEDITPEALQKMHFMDACIRECLRLNSATGVSLRKAMCDMELKSGHVIPKERLCFFHGEEIHLAEDLYGSEANVFNPYHHYKSDAPATTKPTVNTNNDHMCPGRFLAVMGIKIVTAYALRHYDFSTLSGKRPANALRDGVTNLPSHDPIIFRARTSTH